MAEITQEDREAAADYLDNTGVDWGACSDIREGRTDHPVVQAFAAHRRQAEAKAEGLPKDIALAVAKMGKVEWGAVQPKPDEDHVKDFADSLKLTREYFKTEGDQSLHGVYLEGTEIVLCHTGTSPNSANNARALTGAWNWLVDQATHLSHNPHADEGAEAPDSRIFSRASGRNSEGSGGVYGEQVVQSREPNP